LVARQICSHSPKQNNVSSVEDVGKMAQYDVLLSQSLFDISHDSIEYGSPAEIRLSYERARAICRQSGITLQDVVELRPRFWDFHRHFIASVDTAALTILAIHWNLCIGTIGKFAKNRPELHPLLEQLINFDTVGEYMLTEIAHGLDARYLETTATLQEDGTFDLQTPCEGAAKAMPPNSSMASIPRIAVVFARLLANGADYGVKPFVVQLSDATQMCPGVSSRLLPTRSGVRGLDHALTSFNHVKLGPESLLDQSSGAPSRRLDFMKQIFRVPVGTLALSLTNIPALRASAYIAGTYSLRRYISNDKLERLPIINFATQHRPILSALVQAEAFNAFADYAIAIFRDPGIRPDVAAAVAATFKATVSQDSQEACNELADRCGWRGLLPSNRIIEIALALRGNSIAEGDYTVLCIRLVSETLLGRYQLPEAKDKKSLLARHEAGVWQEAQEIAASVAESGHRSEEFNIHLLPLCRKLIRATGHRMAYEAALCSEKLNQDMLNLFESICILSDLSWYCESGGFSRKELFRRDSEAVKAVLPQLECLLSDSGAASWVTAPILDEHSWEQFVQRLPIFENSRGV
jgi:acyl-CoA oxidase